MGCSGRSQGLALGQLTRLRKPSHLPIKLEAPNGRTLRVAWGVAELADVTYGALHAALAVKGEAEIIVAMDLED
ncbi:MAG: hypothetical protein QXY49_00190 [Thermofilaceae archaeon]